MMEPLSSLLSTARGVSCDSRDIAPGYIFVAIRGHRSDGNVFSPDAVQRGALAVVSDQPDLLPVLNVPVYAVPDARRALAELAAEFYGHPSRALPLTGVSGTNGKTTIACMLEHIFRQAGHKAGLIGTLYVELGATRFASMLTTPEPVHLQQYLAAMRQNGVTRAVMEVSAQGHLLSRTHATRFACGVLANVSADHLDFHGTFDDYLAAKSRFATTLGKQTPLVVNIADNYCRAIAAKATGPVITVAVDAPADVTARIDHLSARSSSFALLPSRELPGVQSEPDANPVPFQLALPGKHNIENALLAATAAYIQGIPLPTAAKALATFRPVSRRMEVYAWEDLTVVDDTALNPASLDAVFTTLRDFSYNRLVIADAIRGQRGPAINAANAATLARWANALPSTLVVTASRDSVGAADYVTSAEESAFRGSLKAAGTAYHYTETLEETIVYALQCCTPGDLLVLLGAQGMDDGYRLLASRRQQRPTAKNASSSVEQAI